VSGSGDLPAVGAGDPTLDVAQRIVAGGNAQLAALGSGTQIVNFFAAPDHLPSVPAVALNCLPRNPTYFVNRQNALDQITETAATPWNASEFGSGIVAIDGMAGVGKTTLALHAAHLLAPRFPDAQLYLDLHAHSRGRTPVEPSSALDTLLRALGVSAGEIPDTLDAREAVWRSRLAGRRALLVLDNAASSRQVLPLLPGSQSSLVIVTSRHRLAGLYNARRIGLDLLVIEDAVRLFTWIVGPKHVDSDEHATRQIVESCARLPLAVSLCAARLRYRPVPGTRHLAAELARGANRLVEIRAEGVTITDAFALSYQDLEPDQQRTFRQLGLHPAQEFGVEAAAALGGEDVARVRHRLEELCNQNLLQEPRYGRYQLHDLLHEFAHSLAEREPPAERDRATDRLLDYYIAVAAQANRLIDRLGNRETQVEWEPVAAPTFGSQVEATAWMETERASLHAMLRLAGEQGREERAAQLARAIVYFLRLRGDWQEVLSLSGSMAPVFERIADRAGAADMRFYCGDILRLTGRYQAALEHYEAVLTTYQELADHHREARTLHSIGDVERGLGRFTEAVKHYQAALVIYRERGDVLAQARALHSIADAYRLSDRPAAAIDLYQQILPVYQAFEDPVGEARVRHAVAELHRERSRYEQARAECEQALDAFRRLGDRLGEADAECTLGKIHQADGRQASALRHFRRARAMYRELGDRQGHARTLRHAGSVLVAAGHTAAGVAVLRQALTLYEAAGATTDAERIRTQLDGQRSDSGRTTPDRPLPSMP
jgi:tetratricopeptide (TPR) repeat protein